MVEISGESRAPAVPDDEDILEDEVGEPTPTSPPKRSRPVAEGQGGFIARAWTAQERIARRWDSIGKGRFARVLRMARKPEPEELRHSALVVLVGIAVIGAIGFFIYLFMDWLVKTITPT
jgi:protein transport protein SEC61 subunit gamma and related proteins